MIKLDRRAGLMCRKHVGKRRGRGKNGAEACHLSSKAVVGDFVFGVDVTEVVTHRREKRLADVVPMWGKGASMADIASSLKMANLGKLDISRRTTLMPSLARTEAV